jgi:hypothetical protein
MRLEFLVSFPDQDVEYYLLKHGSAYAVAALPSGYASLFFTQSMLLKARDLMEEYPDLAV